MWFSQVWRETSPQIIQNNWRMSTILHANWSVDFAMDDECEKLGMKNNKEIGKSYFLVESWK